MKKVGVGFGPPGRRKPAWSDLCSILDDELLAATHEFLAELGLNPDHIHELDVPAEDRAHYSKKTIDIEYDYPIGREELMGIAYRTDFDLMNIQRASGKSMEYTIKETNTKFVPHVIEPS